MLDNIRFNGHHPVFIDFAAPSIPAQNAVEIPMIRWYSLWRGVRFGVCVRVHDDHIQNMRVGENTTDANISFAIKRSLRHVPTSAFIPSSVLSLLPSPFVAEIQDAHSSPNPFYTTMSTTEFEETREEKFTWYKLPEPFRSHQTYKVYSKNDHEKACGIDTSGILRLGRPLYAGDNGTLEKKQYVNKPLPPSFHSANFLSLLFYLWLDHKPRHNKNRYTAWYQIQAVDHSMRRRVLAYCRRFGSGQRMRERYLMSRDLVKQDPVCVYVYG